MSKKETAVQFAEQVARDNSIGYKWGGWGPSTGGYDCSHLIIDAFDRAGYGVKSAGASSTRNMRAVFLKKGFSDVTKGVNLKTGAGLRRGDVLLNQANHAALYVGSGRIVQARSDLDGRAGDSSGQEIREQAYYNYPWDCVLRPPAEVSSVDAGSSTPAGDPGTTHAPGVAQQIKSATRYDLPLPLLQYGDRGPTVEAAQILLIGRGFDVGPDGHDGIFGTGTQTAVLRYQARNALDVDAKIGGQTWSALLGL